MFLRLIPFALRNARRSPLRTALTVVAVAVSLVAFLLLRSLGAAWTEQVEQTPDNRVVTHHKLGWAKDLPFQYADAIRKFDGVEAAVGVRWAGLKLPGKEGKFFESFAVEGKPFVDMHYELSAPDEQKAAFLGDRRGALVSAQLAEEFGWKAGDRVLFHSRQYPGQWELTVSAIFRSTRHGFANRAIYFHWEYLNEVIPLTNRDRIALVSAQIRDPNQGARLAQAIDIHFDDQHDRTLSQEDKALTAAFTGQFSAILEAMNFVSWLILAVVLLILGNTVAMSVRERTREYGTLRALGFSPKHLASLVVGEATAIGLCGGLLALPVSYPLIQNAFSRFFEETMALPPLEVPPAAATAAVVIGALLGLLAAAVSARQVARQVVVDALRSVD